METLSKLLDNYCSTVRPLQHWSATKTKALAMLQRDIGHWPLDNLSHANLVKYGIEREGSQTIPLLGRSAAVIARQPRTDARVFPYSQPHCSVSFRRSVTATGRSGIRLHDLRHEGISRLFERGWTIPQVAALSGHRSWANLKRYTHISPEQLHQLADKGSKS